MFAFPLWLTLLSSGRNRRKHYGLLVSLTDNVRLIALLCGRGEFMDLVFEGVLSHPSTCHGPCIFPALSYCQECIAALWTPNISTNTISQLWFTRSVWEEFNFQQIHLLDIVCFAPFWVIWMEEWRLLHRQYFRLTWLVEVSFHHCWLSLWGTKGKK